jgi:hypothetical protein
VDEIFGAGDLVRQAQALDQLRSSMAKMWGCAERATISRLAEPAGRQARLYSMITNTVARLAVATALCVGVAGVILAQTTPLPGPTVPEKSLPVPKGGESLVLNPTKDECKGGWRPDLRWTREEFDKFCGQLEISK